MKVLGPDNVVGTTGSTFTDAISRNSIRNNGGSGVWITGANATGNVVKNNDIFSNGERGVYVSGGANNTTIGGAVETMGQTARAANVLSGTAQNGVRVSGSQQTKIYGNYIGLQSDGTSVLGNGNSGVRLDGGTTGAEIGKAGGFGNVISGNQQMGVIIWGTTCTGNKIQAN